MVEESMSFHGKELVSNMIREVNIVKFCMEQYIRQMTSSTLMEHSFSFEKIKSR